MISTVVDRDKPHHDLWKKRRWLTFPEGWWDDESTVVGDGKTNCVECDGKLLLQLNQFRIGLRHCDPPNTAITVLLLTSRPRLAVSWRLSRPLLHVGAASRWLTDGTNCDSTYTCGNKNGEAILLRFHVLPVYPRCLLPSRISGVCWVLTQQNTLRTENPPNCFDPCFDAPSTLTQN